MTDNQIRELFDTVPFFVDNPIEVLRSSRFIRSMVPNHHVPATKTRYEVNYASLHC